ncbi:MAG: MFS transporter, partial [Acidimicrobiia bacterium]
PEIQQDLGLSPTGVQWIVNAYLLTLAAFFAFGGRISDMFGHKRLVVIGVVVFTAGSIMNGLTPTGDVAEAWFIVFRAVQGFGAALMLPAALAIVVGAYELRERGKALAIFFAITGGLTAVGPIAGGYLSEWTWRAIFWINVPVAIIALILIAKAKIADERHPAPIDVPGLVLIVGGMGLSVLGLQQASQWGWDAVETWACIVGGLALLVVFAFVETRRANPLIRVAIFENRAFTVQNLVLFFSMIAFIPVFFFASMYAQIALGESVSDAGLYLMTFFAGFAVASQFGGRMLDKIGAKVPVVLGCIVGAVGFALWGNSLTDLDFNNQWYFIVIAGAGMGLMLGPSNTDAINRAPRVSYGEVSGVTQTVRNYGASLGMAVLGSILINQNVSNVEKTLAGFDVPTSKAEEIAHSLSGSGGGSPSAALTQQAGSKAEQIFTAVQHDFGQSSRVVFFLMAGAMAVAGLVALIGLRSGRQADLPDDVPDDADARPLPTS